MMMLELALGFIWLVITIRLVLRRAEALKMRGRPTPAMHGDWVVQVAVKGFALAVLVRLLTLGA